MQRYFLTIALFCFLLATKAQIYPTHWFTNMRWNNIELLVHQTNIGQGFTKPTVNYPGVKVTGFTTFTNKNYVAINLNIAASAKPGTFKINTANTSLSYELKARKAGNGSSFAVGVTQKDLIYLLIPDRFSNANTNNDAYPDANDTQADNTNPFLRHGGDLEGVTNKLNYLKDLGVTAIWMTPVVENNTKQTNEGGTMRSSYHGYHFTNQYSIDKRFGGNEAYKQMINAAHAKQIKIVQDAVYNHLGNDHFLVTDKPEADFFNQWPQYQNTSYKDQPLPDIHASQTDKNIAVNGWFTPFLPDLNQKNKHVKNFLIQYQLWATEEFALDAWRIDTYFYSEAKFLNDVNTAMVADFPKLTIFGEAWVQSPANSAYFCKNNINVPFKHNLQGVTDFPFYFATLAAFNEKPGWDNGIQKLYQTVAQDYLYQNPFNNCIFLDNHDLDRIYSVLGEDLEKMKGAHLVLLTHRGIPQLYYGNEVLMKNFKNPSDAEVRKNFEGGWPNDAVNKFEAAGRTAQENDFFNYLKTLANYRKNSDALTNGKFMHYLPFNNSVYVYFRYTNKQTVMVVVNRGSTAFALYPNNYTERTNGFTTAKNIITNQTTLLAGLTVPAGQSAAFELGK
jgi:neopullulanase